MNEVREGSSAAGAVVVGSNEAKASEERLAFGGPVGATAMMVLLPILSVYLWICVHLHGGALVWPNAEVLAQCPRPTAASAFWVAAWVVFQLALDLYLPGRAYKGLPQRDGRRLVYRLNGFLSLLVTLALLAGLLAAGVVRGSVVVDSLGSLLVTSILFAYLLARSSTSTASAIARRRSPSCAARW